MATEIPVPAQLSATPPKSCLTLLSDYKRLNLPQTKQIHARMLRLNLISDPHSATQLLTAYALSPDPDLPYALRLFRLLPNPNTYSFNTLIRAHASAPHPHPRLALSLFSTMPLPDKFTFPFAIKAAADLPAPAIGTAIHAMLVKSLFSSDIYILNSLITFYAACGDLHLSCRLFETIPRRDVVSWNSIIAAFVQADRSDQALAFFYRMEGEGVQPNARTMVTALSACGSTGHLQLGRRIHARVPAHCLILNNAVLHMYIKCGSLEEAKALFGSMTERDSISWTTMLSGFAKSGEFDAARGMFNAMPNHDTASWNALMSGYEQNGRPKEALDLFHRMQRADAKPDRVTLVAALSACAQLGALHLGCWIHTFIDNKGLDLNFHLTTSLVDMYSKCGDLDKALKVFGSVHQRDVFVWSAMIGGLAMHGRGKDALELFLQMLRAQVKPNGVTFTNVLCACSHSGLVEEGRLYFAQMLPVYGIEPEPEHYACMVDILGRAGLVEEARELVVNMPMQPPASVWGALLGACVLHKNVELADKACAHLLELDPRNDAAYVLLSNLHAKSGNWGAVSKLRKQMKSARLRKEPGSSSIEVDGVIHEFLVGDTSHPLSRRIYLKLDEITSKLKALGYAPNRTQVLQDIEEEDVMDRALSLHSERLAIAFGLISTNPQAPIRITKNLRVCDDCHSVAKLISTVYNRVIVLRDRYRFHHFRDGNCSCMDYW